MALFPRLRLRDPAIDLVDLPWELPLAEWSADRLVVPPRARSGRRATSSGSSSRAASSTR